MSGKGVQANSVQYIMCKNGFTSGTVVYVVTCRGLLTVFSRGPNGGWRDVWMCKELLLSGRHS